jgi:[acyl-carrier-protein] S-malonyltransferase
MDGFGILCPGQGDQHEAMFDILSDSETAQEVLKSASGTLGGHPGEYLRQVSPSQLFSNLNAQLLISLLQLATWTALRELLPEPRVFAGYSMGELSAYGCAGALGLNDTLSLMRARAAIMDSVSPLSAGLVAVRGLDRKEIDTLCSASGVEVAIVNGLDHYIIGGTDDVLCRAEEHPLLKKASTVKRLQVAVPSHTSWLAEAGRQFERELDESPLKRPFHPVVAGVNGALVRSRADAIQSLAKQISHPINWMVCTQTVTEMGCNVILELGPGNALTKMLQENTSRVYARSVADFRSLQGVADWVQRQLY